MPRTDRSAARPLAATPARAAKKGKPAKPAKAPVKMKVVKPAKAAKAKAKPQVRAVAKSTAPAKPAEPQLRLAPAPSPTGPTVKNPSAPPPLPKTPPTIPPPAPRHLAAVPASAPTSLVAMVDERPRFKVGDRCVHPAHGVGEVTTVEAREIGGTAGLFYTLRILDNGIKVMVPVSAATQVGLRPIMSAEEADAVLDTMRAREVAVDMQPWSRRFRAYTEMMKTGSAYEIAKVLRDMYRLRFDKDLSFGERRLLDQAKSLLMKELAFAKRVTEAQMSADVAAMFSA